MLHTKIAHAKAAEGSGGAATANDEAKTSNKGVEVADKAPRATAGASEVPPADIARDRFKSTRDPAAPSGAIVVPNLDENGDKHPAANTGSRFFSSNVDGDWIVCNARFQIVRKGPFKNEQEASDEAARLNGLPEAATLDFE